ncbi:hypothetical protein LTR41_004923 [Exophiala xenobiotica]|nr:hypothetical protein LTR41_004923 [Exophiala xenobiotica]
MPLSSPVMKAWRYTSTTGGLEKNLRLDTNTPLPDSATQLGPDQVLVEVHYAGINPVDYKFAEIPLLSRLLAPRPATPGYDYAGKVVAVGPNSGKVSEDKLELGQLVYGRLGGPSRYGTLTQYVVVPRDGAAPLPEHVRLQDAASIGTAGLSAYQSIVPFVRQGSRVFINGGSGGTGAWGIQIAKELGCYVVASCSGRNEKLCRDLGADEVIDYQTTDLLPALIKYDRPFDLVMDNAGNSNALYWQMHQYTTPGAVFVQVAGTPSWEFMAEWLKRLLWPSVLGGAQRKLLHLRVRNNYADFVQMGKWLEEGKIQAVVEEVVPFAQVPRAFEQLKSHRVRGKVLIKVAEGEVEVKSGSSA